MVCALFCFACASVLIKAVGQISLEKEFMRFKLLMPDFFLGYNSLFYRYFVRPEVKPTHLKLHFTISMGG